MDQISARKYSNKLRKVTLSKTERTKSWVNVAIWKSEFSAHVLVETIKQKSWNKAIIVSVVTYNCTISLCNVDFHYFHYFSAFDRFATSCCRIHTIIFKHNAQSWNLIKKIWRFPRNCHIKFLLSIFFANQQWPVSLWGNAHF